MDPMNETVEDQPQGEPKPWRLAAIYGTVMAFALFIVGWITGLGGAVIPNLLFSALMGLLAAVLFRLVLKFRGGK